MSEHADIERVIREALEPIFVKAVQRGDRAEAASREKDYKIAKLCVQIDVLEQDVMLASGRATHAADALQASEQQRTALVGQWRARYQSTAEDDPVGDAVHALCDELEALAVPPQEPKAV